MQDEPIKLNWDEKTPYEGMKIGLDKYGKMKPYDYYKDGINSDTDGNGSNGNAVHILEGD
jgi:hypothetical protein